MVSNLFLNENWLDFNDNLEVGNLDPHIQILQLRYCKNSCSSQNTKIAYLDYFIFSAHNYNFIQFDILYLAHYPLKVSLQLLCCPILVENSWP